MSTADDAEVPATCQTVILTKDATNAEAAAMMVMKVAAKHAVLVAATEEYQKRARHAMERVHTCVKHVKGTLTSNAGDAKAMATFGLLINKSTS